MSFINLMANDIWSDADITRRTESMIRTEFSQEAETILNRKVLGMALGTYQPTPADQLDIARYDAAAKAAQAAGLAARADMALLMDVFAMEAAQQALGRPQLPDDASDEEKAADAAERAAAQGVLDGASAEAKALYDRRNPIMEVADV